MTRTLAILCFGLLATNVWAQDDESYTSYDAIVNELKASAEEEPVIRRSDWNEVALHAGMSFVTSFMDVSGAHGSRATGMLKGIEGHVASNLFTRQARAELAFRTFAPESFSGDVQINLKELEARLVLLPELRERTYLRMGFGLAARFLETSSRTASVTYNGPASTVLLGFEHRLSPSVSVGPDVAYRNELARGAPDKTAWDAAIRLNATF